MEWLASQYSKKNYLHEGVLSEDNTMFKYSDWADKIKVRVCLD